MAEPGAVLVRAPPSRPLQARGRVWGGPDDQCGEQEGDLVAGEGDLAVRGGTGSYGGCDEGE